MDLKTRVRHYLNGLSKERTVYVFPSQISQVSLLGSIHGQLVCFVVIDGKRILSSEELAFKSKIEKAQGEFYTIRDMEDLFFISKERGWV